MKAVILGATRGIGRALGRVMAEQGHTLFVLGRNPEDLARTAVDLKERSGGSLDVGFFACDLESPETFGPALDAADAHLGAFDTVIVTAGLFATQAKLEEDPALTERMLRVNFTNTVVFLEHARARLLARGGGTLCAFSSVAGERGRKPVVLYGASKAGLSAYLEGLDHKYRQSGLRVVCVKPGFVRTSMTEGLPAPPFAGDPEPVAKDVLRALGRGAPVLYTPRPWALVMFIIRHLPRLVMRKVGF